MMSNTALNDAIPHELFAKPVSHCTDAVLSKSVTDIPKVQHHPSPIGLVDLANCYNATIHGISGIAFRAWRQSQFTVRVVLTCFCLIQFCLRTGFRELKEKFGGTESDPIAGYGQGHGFARGGFSFSSTLIINAHKRRGHGKKHTSSKAVRLFLLAAVTQQWKSWP